MCPSSGSADLVHLRAAGVSLVLDAPRSLARRRALGSRPRRPRRGGPGGARGRRRAEHGAERPRRGRPVLRPASRALVRVERAARSARLPVGARMVAAVRPDRVPGHRRPGGRWQDRRHRCGRRSPASRSRSRSSSCRPAWCAQRASGHRDHRRAPTRSTAWRSPLPVPAVATELFDFAGRWAPRAVARSACRSPSGVHSRENRRGRTGPDAPADPRRRHRRLRHPPGRGVGGARGVERQPPSRYAERALERASPCSAAASCCCRARSCWRAGETYTGPWVYGSLRRRARRASPTASTPSCAPARTTRAARGRSCSTPGRPSTSTTTSAGSTALAERAARGRRRAVRARRRLVPRTAATTPPGSATGTSTRTCGRTGCTRSSTTSAGSAWSSGSGSSPRWSTPTPTWPARTPTGSCAHRRPDCRCRRGTSRCSTSATPTPTPTSSSGSTRC